MKEYKITDARANLYSIPGYVESLEKAYEETDLENAKTYNLKDW